MKLFVDTAAWLALNDKTDQHHKEALIKVSKIKESRVELVTSEYIFDEAITLIRYRVSHYSAVIFGESMLNSSIVKVLDVANKDRLKAWELFQKYKDKELSFTDCTSFVLMNDLKLHKVFTFDAHFSQAGFELF